MPTLVHTTAVLATINGISHAATVTIPSTTAGNCLVVVVQGENSSGSGSITGILLGASADNFGSVKTVEKADSGNSVWTDVVVWADPNCAGSQTSVKVTFNANWAGNGSADITVYEVSGLVTTLASLLDQSSTGTGASTSYSSGSTATTTVAAEFWVGAAYCINGVATLPSSPWTDSGINTADGNAGCGSQITSSTGTALYNGTQTSGTVIDWAALVVTLKGTGSSPTPSPFTPRRAAIGRPAAVRGTGKGSAGAKYVAFPSHFTPPRKPAKGAQASTRGRSSSAAGKYVHIIPPGPSPFTLPVRPAKGQTARRGSSIAHSGAPYVAFPSPFTPPKGPARGAQAAARGRPESVRGLWTGPAPFTLPVRPARGAQAATRGHAASSPGARFVLVRVSPFPQPHGPARGASAVPRTGHAHSSPGARFVLIQTSPFIRPKGPARGRSAARRGSGSAGSATGRGAPFIPRKLIVSIASAAGTDDYGNAYPQGIMATAGVIEGPSISGSDITGGAISGTTITGTTINGGTITGTTITGTTIDGNDFIINDNGEFFYSGTPGPGNLVASVTNSAGTDSFGNSYQAGLTAYDGLGNWIQISSASIAFSNGVTISNYSQPDVAVLLGTLRTTALVVNGTQLNIGLAPPSGPASAPSSYTQSWGQNITGVLNSIIATLGTAGIW